MADAIGQNGPEARNTPQDQVIPDPSENFNDVYISEDLTEARQNLLFKCRQARRSGRIMDSWSHDGQILIKDNTAHIKRISREIDIPVAQSGDQVSGGATNQGGT